MSEGEIRPALTPEECYPYGYWDAKDRGSSPAFVAHDRTEATIQHNPPGCLRVDAGRTTLEFSGPDLHAIAALALHGQPFGFTWQDVELLREAAMASDLWDRDDANWTPETGGIIPNREMSNLADRIAALLPPRPEAGEGDT